MHIQHLNVIQRWLNPPLRQVHPRILNPLLVSGWHVRPGLALEGPWPGFTNGPQWQHELTALHAEPFEERGVELAAEYLEAAQDLAL